MICQVKHNRQIVHQSKLALRQRAGSGGIIISCLAPDPATTIPPEQPKILALHCAAIPSPENFLAEGCENFLDRGGLRLGILVVEGRSLKTSITEAKDHGLNKIQNLAGG
jgi:hypothetical protein